MSTPARTFVLYPLGVIAFELVVRRGNLVIVPWGALLLVWGYLQYRLTGHFRVGRGGGGPGITVPPEHLVQDGLYAYTRNPMYLGHLIFMTGGTARVPVVVRTRVGDGPYGGHPQDYSAWFAHVYGQ